MHRSFLSLFWQLTSAERKPSNCSSDQVQSFGAALLALPAFVTICSSRIYNIWLIIVMVLKWLSQTITGKAVDWWTSVIVDKGKLLVDNCRSMGLTAYDVGFARQVTCRLEQKWTVDYC